MLIPYTNIDTERTKINEPQSCALVSLKSTDFEFLMKSCIKIIKNMIIKKSENSIISNLRKPGGETKETEIMEPKVNNFNFALKWAWQDSNLRPTDYESVALTN